MKFLDIFFTIFHSALVLFVLFGWIWHGTRKLHLYIVLLTAGSWLILGIFYGLGYCPLTDWHFQILARRGYNGLPSSYISFLVIRITGLRPNQSLVDVLTTVGLVMGIAGNILLRILSRNRSN